MPDNSRRADAVLSWTPLLAGVLNSYGPIAFNYGFALYFLDYRHGFVKRGLIGELFSSLGFMSRGTLVAIEYIFLGVAFALTYLVFRPVLFGSSSERRLAAALLSAPALLPHLGYLFAQPDVVLYILLLGCFTVFVRARPAVAAIVSCLLSCVALLAHEAFCLMFYPLILAMLLYLCARRRLAWLVGAAHLLIVGAVFVAVIHWGTLKISPDALLLEAQAHTNVGIQRQLYDVMASNLQQQWALVHRMYTPGVIRILVLTLFLTAPYLILLARLLRGTMRAAGLGSLQQNSTAVLFVSPLLLCALGHDTTRWIGAMCIDATFFLLYLYLTEPPGSAVRKVLQDWANGTSFVPWLAYLLAVGPYGATGLRAADQIVSALYGP
ncbi:MAG TPA: hypothetical protein VF865_12720 [Acidobacteriaceae bacterium]